VPSLLFQKDIKSDKSGRRRYVYALQISPDFENLQRVRLVYFVDPMHRPAKRRPWSAAWTFHRRRPNFAICAGGWEVKVKLALMRAVGIRPHITHPS